MSNGCAAAKAAKAKPAAAGAAKSCCSSKAKAKPAAAGDAKSCCSSKAKAKPAAASNMTLQDVVKRKAALAHSLGNKPVISKE